MKPTFHKQRAAKWLKAIGLPAILFMSCVHANAQGDASPIKIFGYFQNSLQQWSAFENLPKRNSFSLQQLNLFFQKDFDANWSAFVNFEFLNNFSSSRQWGSGNLEEAWLKYRLNMRFNLKLGLLLPIFNDLNEIKNRTPILPYVIRPLAYETSFSEIIPTDLLTPVRAFVQAYGFFPAKEAKLDYAIFLGNSPNVNSNPDYGQTGIDTTATFLVGGRFGIRLREFKIGISGTYDKDSIFESFADVFEFPRSDFSKIPKKRLGGDLSFENTKFSFKSEIIKVDMKSDLHELDANLDFFYGTLGYFATERLFFYGTYWLMDQRLAVAASSGAWKENADISVSSFGFSYTLSDRITLKAQYAYVNNINESEILGQKYNTDDDFKIASAAISVFF
ncbi:MAG: hypothetical protein H6695_02825 [Deferribacteres bacterium]|nr:hypothetical protein [candidate division KSB1 bacterium]MCB9509081.1 hypothetical protein [Deferribacteres bacterium]